MNKANFDQDIIVFSHLRWEFVWQRPQHLLSRLAKNRKILFIEEPIEFDAYNVGTANVIRNDNVTVIQPRINPALKNDLLPPLVKKHISENEIKNPVLWFYSPMFVDMAKHIDNVSLIVFDSMDQLAAFKGAPEELVDQERKLFEMADIVFTGGKSLFKEKKKYHNNVFCFPSSVDQAHFEKALKRETRVPEDIQKVKKPIVGYYGVIDERIDLDLLSEVSQKLPEISFVMIGPVVKINPEELPKADNLFYLGSKKYEELPNYLKAFDVAIMPFAMNESTKFISPTKTLEYMAAAKPIISTPIYDVVRDYSEVVSIANNPAEFVQAIKRMLAQNLNERKVLVNKENAIIQKTSWDMTTEKMEAIMTEEMEKKKFLKKPRTNKNSDSSYLIANFQNE